MATIRVQRTAIGLLGLWSFFIAQAITATNAQEAQIEITRVDITKIEGLISTRVSILGVQLGDKVEEAEKKLSAEPRLVSWLSDNMLRVGRREQFEKEGMMKTNGIANFIISDGIVDSMSINELFEDRLVGDTRKLLHIKYDPNTRRKLLGVEDLTENAFGSTKYIYLKEGIQVLSGDVGIIEFVYPAKKR